MSKFNHILLYGKNEGFKNQVIENLLKKKAQSLNYEEREILENPDQFIESLLSKSLFEDEKIILIKNIYINPKSFLILVAEIVSVYGK